MTNKLWDRSLGWARVKGWNRYNAALVLVIILSVVFQRFWISTNQEPPHQCDDSEHLLASILLYRTLIEHGPLALITQFLNTVSHAYHPPLIPVLTSPFYACAGQTLAAALWFNTLSMVLLFVYSFKLIKHLANERLALITVITTALFPMTFGLASHYLLELGLATIVVTWLYYFQRSDCLAERRYLPWLGLLLGCGLLVKVTFPLYIAGPVALDIFYKGRQRLKGRLQTAIGRILIVSAIGCLLALPWYWKHIGEVWSGVYTVSGSMIDPAVLKTMLSWKELALFWIQVIKVGISTYFFILGLVFLLIVIMRGKWAPDRALGFLLAWWIVPFLVCSVASMKIDRYLFPAFPALAGLLSIAIVRTVPLSSLRHVLMLGGLLIIPVGNFLQLSFFDVWTRLPASILAREPLGVLEKAEGFEFAHRARHERWSLGAILETLQQQTSAQPLQQIRGIAYIISWPLLTANIMFLAATRNILLFLDLCAWDGGPITPCLDQSLDAQHDYEFLIIEWPIDQLAVLAEKLDALSVPYREIATIPALESPEGQDQATTVVVIYQRKL